jgi:hypothetical protein
MIGFGTAVQPALVALRTSGALWHPTLGCGAGDGLDQQLGLAQAQDAVPEQAGLDTLSLPYAVEQSTVSGGGYRLASLPWQVSGTASGGGYRLQSPTAPMLRGSGCCCTYLPLSLRGFR